MQNASSSGPRNPSRINTSLTPTKAQSGKKL